MLFSIAMLVYRRVHGIDIDTYIYNSPRDILIIMVIFHIHTWYPYFHIDNYVYIYIYTYINMGITYG